MNDNNTQLTLRFWVTLR